VGSETSTGPPKYWSVVKGHGIAGRYVYQVGKGNMRGPLPNLRASFRAAEDVRYLVASRMEEKHWAIWF